MTTFVKLSAFKHGFHAGIVICALQDSTRVKILLSNNVGNIVWVATTDSIASLKRTVKFMLDYDPTTDDFADEKQFDEDTNRDIDKHGSLLSIVDMRHASTSISGNLSFLRVENFKHPFHTAVVTDSLKNRPKTKTVAQSNDGRSLLLAINDDESEVEWFLEALVGYSPSIKKIGEEEFNQSLNSAGTLVIIN